MTTFDPVEHELSMPNTDQARYDWPAVAAKAMTQPRRWLMVDTEAVPTTVTRVNTRDVAALRDIEGWRFEGRATDVTKGPHRRCTLWVRAIESTSKEEVLQG